jgi:hypothetical protein
MYDQIYPHYSFLSPSLFLKWILVIFIILLSYMYMKYLNHVPPPHTSLLPLIHFQTVFLFYNFFIFFNI